MSDKNLARRTEVEIAFAGVDITKSIRPYLLALTYTDNEEDGSDDLQISLQDRAGLWLHKWLAEAVAGAASARLRINAVILRKNWQGNGKDKLLDCGSFELDSVTAQGPPAAVVIKATSLPYSSKLRQTRQTKAWEAYTLSGIARELAAVGGMTCMYEAAADPFYERIEQVNQSNISFLAGLCHNAGLSLKASSDFLILFDQLAFEKKPVVVTIKQGDGSYLKYKLGTASADVQYTSCRVSYVDPGTGRLIEGAAQAEEAGKRQKGRQLNITAKVADKEAAVILAQKQLRLHNKFAMTASFTLPGDTRLVAGVTVQLVGWGGWSGKYIISQAVHTVDSGGYTTQISLRRVLAY